MTRISFPCMGGMSQYEPVGTYTAPSAIRSAPQTSSCRASWYSVTGQPDSAKATAGATSGTSGAESRTEGTKADTDKAKPTAKADTQAAKPAKAKPAERSVPSARLSSYAAEAAKLLAGSSTTRRKRKPEALDPVTEDEQGKESRPLRKGQAKPSAKD